ncbi:MAG: hypothetical protein ACJ8F3_09350 [Xanthobacteraceae bacterium]
MALALMLNWQSGALAQSAEDEELPADTRIMRQFLKDLGLQRDEPDVDFRERAPLVVPPTRTLPPPRSEGSVANNPAWPKDPDVAKRKVEAARSKAVAKSAAEAMINEGRPLSPSELEKGRVATGSVSTTRPQTPEESARPMTPEQLGTKKNIFSGMFSTFVEKDESAEFTGEPKRDSLTAPPPGYQTPSPSQPYGISPKKEQPKAANIEDRATSYSR